MFVVVGVKDIKEKGNLTLEQVKPYIENQVRIEKKAEVSERIKNCAAI
jgi:hypothetical protein